MNDTFVHGGGDYVLDNTADILLKAVRSDNTLIGLRGINAFCFFGTDGKNTANPAVKTDHRRHKNLITFGC